MAKKYTKEIKIQACKDFLEEKKSRKQIALELHMGKKEMKELGNGKDV